MTPTDSSRNRDAIHVVLAVDRRCTLGCAVSMRSVIANAVTGTPLHFHIVAANDVAQDDLDRLSRTVLDDDAGDRQVSWYRFDPSPLAHLQRSKLITHTAYVKLLLGDLLPDDLARCIWVDCDLVFDRPIDELWETNLEGHAAGAVMNGSRPEMARYQRRLGLREPKYFNSGVILIDLRRWRERRVGPRALQFAEAVGEDLILHDQDALNGALQEDWLALPRHWNMWVIHPMLHADSRAVFHFMGYPKPWHADYDRPHGERFYAYLDDTPYRGWRPWNPLGLGRAARRLHRRMPFLPGVVRVVKQRLSTSPNR